MKSLDELMDGACARVLSEDEMTALCDLAKKEGAAQKVVLKLLSAGTAAGRTNLVAARTLTAAYAPRKPRADRRLPLRSIGKHHQPNGIRVGNVPFAVTNHAFERYVERHLSGLPIEEALASLVEEAESARPMRERTMNGEQQWTGRSGVIFVMRRDGDGARPICVTVLPREEDQARHRIKREGKPHKRA